MYELLTIDGTSVTKDTIAAAMADHRAVIHWRHGEWKNIGNLAIYESIAEAEEAANHDTRGECYSMAEEVWSQFPESLAQAITAARGLLVLR